MFGVAVVAALALPAVAAPSGKRLVRVWLSGGLLHATYHLPAGMQPYGINFAHRGDPAYPMMLLPGAADGTVTPTSFTSTHLTAQNLTSTDYNADGTLNPTTYTVSLLYGRKGVCGGSAAWNANNLSWNRMLQCPHLRSNTLPLTVGQLIGPGTLVGSSSGNGDFASASVSGNVKNPNTFTIRITSSPSGQSIYIAWDITCSKGFSVKGASGSSADTTPVNDTSIQVPFASLTANPDSCTIAVDASLAIDPSDPTTVPSGTLTIRVYVNKSHI